MSNTHALRGRCVTLVSNPFEYNDSQALRYEEDGLIIIKEGRISAFGSYDKLKETLGDIPVSHYKNQFILPGFIDTHIHMPQTQMIAAYGEGLVQWLNQYTFPTETQFSELEHCETVAQLFINECLRNGTTTAVVYGSAHAQSIEAFFTCALKHNLRMIGGKVMMDRNAPDALCMDREVCALETEALIQKWHNKERLSYAITPRFAPSCSNELLKIAGQLYQKHPGVYMQTHLSENTNEVAWVQSLFPQSKSYLDVYDHYGLIGKGSIFGHCIYLKPEEWQRLQESESSIAHCPTSNAFLGSGLFDWHSAIQHPQVPIGLATDVGAGTSFSMLKTMGMAYQIALLNQYTLSPSKLLYLSTLGAAKSLHLDDKIGSIEVGKEADLIVLDPCSTALLDFRMEHADSFEEALFAQMIMADDRAIKAVYIAGKDINKASL